MNAVGPPEVSAILLLGSNIQPARYLPQGVLALRDLLPVQAVSSVWQSPPVGTTQGGPFLNAAVLVRSPWPARALKARLRILEAALGRVRTADKFAPRTLDLDIVVWADQGVDPDLWRYAHVAVPVAELWPHLPHPTTGEPLAAVAQRLRVAASLQPRPDVLLPAPFQRGSKG